MMRRIHLGLFAALAINSLWAIETVTTNYTTSFGITTGDIDPNLASGVITNGSLVYLYEYGVRWMNIRYEQESEYGITSWSTNCFVCVQSNLAQIIIGSLRKDVDGKMLYEGDVVIPDILIGSEEEKRADVFWAYFGYSLYGKGFGELGAHSFDKIRSITIPEGCASPIIQNFSMLYSTDPLYNFGLWKLEEMTVHSSPSLFSVDYLSYTDRLNIERKHYEMWRKLLENFGYGGIVHIIGTDITGRIDTINNHPVFSSNNAFDSSILFNGDVKHSFNGLVRDSDGVMCGIVQIATAKQTIRGVRVSGFVMLEDGKKQSLKQVTVAVEKGLIKFVTKVGKIGDLSLTISGSGFSGTLGDMTVASEIVDENTAVLRGTLTMSYFDAKTDKVKTKKVTINGVTSDGEAIGTVTVKGLSARSFVAESEE